MNIDDPRFQDPEKAREYPETQRWPHGPSCPHCGNADPEKITSLKGKAHRAGLHQCNECREQFTVTVGTVMERSKIPLNKWLLAMHLLGSSKKGMSAHQLHRMLGITYQSAWFLCHRIREAMTDRNRGPMGGSGKTVEADETYIGRLEGVPKQRTGGAHKNIVLTLVERGGCARSFHIDGTTIGTLIPIIRANVARETAAMTDQASWYKNLRSEPALRRTKPSITAKKNTFAVTSIPTQSKATFRSSSVACAAFINIVAKSICIAI